MPGYAGDIWVAAFLPAHAPALVLVLGRLHGAIARARAAPAVRERILASGTQNGAEPAAAFAAFLAAEMAAAAHVVRDAGIRIE